MKAFSECQRQKSQHGTTRNRITIIHIIHSRSDAAHDKKILTASDAVRIFFMVREAGLEPARP